jgi:hypothetical protein
MIFAYENSTSFYSGFNSKPLKDMFRLVQLNNDIANSTSSAKSFSIKNIYKFDLNKQLSISNFIFDSLINNNPDDLFNSN